MIVPADGMPAGKDEIMKRVICNIEYDTETSTLIMKKTFGNFGDPWGYEERLYQTAGGKFFLWCSGGFNSPYPKEIIVRIAADKVENWKEDTKRSMA
jgi:hypothetical protein